MIKQYGFWTSFLSAIAILLACQESNKPDWSLLEAKYQADVDDALKHKAVHFLKRNMDSAYSEKLVFEHTTTGEEILLGLDTIASEASLKNTMDREGLRPSYRKLADQDVLTTARIDQEISAAFEAREKYGWAWNVPDSLFLHYVLPYKVAAEYPREWRTYFNEKYRGKLDSLHHAGVTNVEEVTRALVKDLESWYRFDPRNYLMSDFPDLQELLYSSKGECFRIAYLYTYALRAAGIPCVVDIVPMWGSQNAGHAEYVSLDSTGKLRSNVATAHQNGLQRAAKVFRLTFEDNDTFSQGILPFIGKYPFLIRYLMHDHIVDVTDEHAKTIDIPYRLSGDLDTIPFAYICVLNYDRWMPVFWGANRDGSLLFEKMNTGMLYRIGLPDGEKMKLVDEVIFVDTLGNVKPVYDPAAGMGSMKLTRTNSGGNATLEAGSNYTLQQLRLDGS